MDAESNFRIYTHFIDRKPLPYFLNKKSRSTFYPAAFQTQLSFGQVLNLFSTCLFIFSCLNIRDLQFFQNSRTRCRTTTRRRMQMFHCCSTTFLRSKLLISTCNSRNSLSFANYRVQATSRHAPAGFAFARDRKTVLVVVFANPAEIAERGCQVRRFISAGSLFDVTSCFTIV